MPGPYGSIIALVMELVEGEDLSAHIARLDSAGGARLELDEAISGTGEATATAPLPVAVAVVVVAPLWKRVR